MLLYFGVTRTERRLSTDTKANLGSVGCENISTIAPTASNAAKWSMLYSAKKSPSLGVNTISAKGANPQNHCFATRYPWMAKTPPIINTTTALKNRNGKRVYGVSGKTRNNGRVKIYCILRSKVDTQSAPKWTLNPEQGGHRFRSEAATQSGQK